MTLDEALNEMRRVADLRSANPLEHLPPGWDLGPVAFHVVADFRMAARAKYDRLVLDHAEQLRRAASWALAHGYRPPAETPSAQPEPQAVDPERVVADLDASIPHPAPQ